jgi:hypothetical protein
MQGMMQQQKFIICDNVRGKMHPAGVIICQDCKWSRCHLDMPSQESNHLEAKYFAKQNYKREVIYPRVINYKN